jgi:hypothetical protein
VTSIFEREKDQNRHGKKDVGPKKHHALSKESCEDSAWKPAKTSSRQEPVGRDAINVSREERDCSGKSPEDTSIPASLTPGARCLQFDAFGR